MRALYGFLVFIGILLLILPLSILVIKTSADFSMFNTKWNGCSEFAKVSVDRGELVPVLYPYNSVDFAKREGVLIIVGPDVGFSTLEIEELRFFLDRGGTLFIAEDFGIANDLLEKLGIPGKFSNKPMSDIFYSKRAEFPVIVRIEDPELSYGVENLILNVPSVITGLGGGEEEVFSSKVSVVGENRKSYPILAETSYGKGRVVLLSDPDILINDMAVENNNFIENLVGYLSSNSNTFYFDEAHHSDFNPYSTTTVYIHRELDKGKAFRVFAVVAALMIFIESGIAMGIAHSIWRLIPTRARGREDLFEGLPDWIDIKTLRQIVNEIKRGSKISDEQKGKRIYRKGKEGG